MVKELISAKVYTIIKTKNMNMKILNSKLCMSLTMVGLLFVSCNDNETIEMITAESLTEEEVITLIESDVVSDEMDNLIDDFLYGEIEIAGKTEDSSKDETQNRGRIPDCAVKTVIEEGNLKTVIIDFGEGCEGRNENILSGKVIITYEKNEELMSITISKTFEDFFFNDIEVTGEKNIVRKRENDNGKPESTTTMNITHTWPDGEFNSKVGFKTREWAEGSETKPWSDNIFLISGEWTNNLKNGDVYSSIIIEELRRELVCKFMVSGIIEISKPEVSCILNFGDGFCDDKATLTNSDGEEKEITIKRRNRK